MSYYLTRCSDAYLVTNYIGLPFLGNLKAQVNFQASQIVLVTNHETNPQQNSYKPGGMCPQLVITLLLGLLA